MRQNILFNPVLSLLDCFTNCDYVLFKHPPYSPNRLPFIYNYLCDLYYNVTAIHAKAGKVQNILEIIHKWNNSRIKLGLPNIVPFFVEAGSDTDILLLTFFSDLESSILEYKTSIKRKKDKIMTLEQFMTYNDFQMKLAANSMKIISTMNKIIKSKKK